MRHRLAGQKPLHAVLYSAMLALLLFAIVYYRLRIFSDTAGYITDITGREGFFIAHYRFISVLNQWLPVLLVRLHASLEAVVAAYSLAYSLLPVGLALLCMHWLKKPYHGLALLMQVLLMNMLLFFYSVSELQSGLCLLLFYDALSERAGEGGFRKPFLILSVCLMPTIAFSHPMALPTYIGWLCYRLLKDRAQGFRFAGISAACFFAAILFKRIWFISSYDLVKAPGFESLRQFGPHYYTGPFARSFYAYLQAEAFLVPLVLLTTIVLLLALRKFRLLFFMLLAIAGMYTMVLIVFEDWFTNLYHYYYEHIMQPVIFFLILLFCYALSLIRRGNGVKAIGLAVLFIIAFAKIMRGSEPHKVRQQWLSRCLMLMDGLHIKKAVAGRKWVPEGQDAGTYWSANWETLVLSALEGPQNARTLFLAWDISGVKEPVHATDEIVGDGISFKQSTLSPRYFRLDDKPYVFLEHTVPDSVLERLRAR